MLVCYSFAHTNPRKSGGAETLGGVSERTVSRNAFGPFKDRLTSEGISVAAFRGQLNRKIRKINSAIKKAERKGRPWASVALHFNNTPYTYCDKCEKKTRAGFPCLYCKAPPARKWKLGHTAIVDRYSYASEVLAEAVLERLGQVMIFSKRKELIKIPDPNYGALWPRAVRAPAALIEAGFGAHTKFSEWLERPENQQVYGLVVAEGILEFFKRQQNIPLSDWGK
jgi:hypothetical protein